MRNQFQQRRPLAGPESVRPRNMGLIEEYARSLVQLSPDLFRPETIIFEATVTAGGVFAARTETQHIEPNFGFSLRRIKGYISDPVNSVVDAHLIRFNIRDQGSRRGGLFATPMSMAGLVGGGGSTHDMEYDSFYSFFRGGDLSVDWTAGATTQPTVVYGVILTGDLVNWDGLAAFLERMENEGEVLPPPTAR